MLDWLKNIGRNLRYFWLPRVIFVLMLIVAFFGGDTKSNWLYLLMVIFVAGLVFKPMNIIHGMIGTRGDIRWFFFTFIFINFVFAGIYFFAFFKEAGITYETNQPHIEFYAFKGVTPEEKIIQCDNEAELLFPTCTDSAHYYYKTEFWWVFRNTLLTSLMQEPTDFLSAVGTFTGQRQNPTDRNYSMSEAFHWFLIFHIMISWILLGVFISLIYQKFRNN